MRGTMHRMDTVDLRPMRLAQEFESDGSHARPVADAQGRRLCLLDRRLTAIIIAHAEPASDSSS
jgi:hypothetical protein